MKAPRLLVAVACAVALGLFAAASAAAVPLKRGIYDCMAYDYASGFSLYKSSIKIKGHNRYEHAFGRDHAKLTDKTEGTYKRKGPVVSFKKGAMNKMKARVKLGSGDNPQPYMELLFEGEPSGIDCYFVTKP